jgi:hypothetical protein
VKRRSNKELIGEPRSHPLLDDTFRFDPATWTERLHKRERGLQAKNAERRRKAEANYQKYRDIVGRLIAEDPKLRRATPNRLAKKVREELIKEGRAVSARTIWKAFRPKNKV